MNNHAVVIADANGVIQFWSPAAEARFGHGDAVGQTLDMIVPGQFAEAHWAGFKRAMASGAAVLEGQVTPFPVQHANGELAVTPGRLTLIRAPDGTVIAAAVTFE